MAYKQQETETLRKVGLGIRAARKAKGIAQEELAYLSNVARGYMGNVERGESNVSLLFLKKVADTLGVPVSDFFKEA